MSRINSLQEEINSLKEKVIGKLLLKSEVIQIFNSELGYSDDIYIPNVNLSLYQDKNEEEVELFDNLPKIKVKYYADNFYEIKDIEIIKEGV